MNRNYEKWIFKFSAVFISVMSIFAYGVAVGGFKLTPYETISNVYKAGKSLWKYGRLVPDNQLIHSVYAEPTGATTEGNGEMINISHPDLMMDGYYIFAGWDDQTEHYSAWLYDQRGELRHTWVIDYYALDADGPLNDSDAPHGLLALPDGSIIVNFDRGDVMGRIDDCGNPIWVKKGVFHHSLQLAEDGSCWTWRGEGSAYSHYQYLVNFSTETGKTLKEVGLVEDIIKKMDKSAGTLLLRPDYKFTHFKTFPGDDEDIFHPNDIDVLYSDIASMFPGFNAGDLLISLKKMNLVAVLDSKKFTFKWWCYGPWKRQHDPDFIPDGRISIYNNNNGLGRSEIVQISPVTRQASIVLAEGDTNFYSEQMGKHQYLPNGNILIVVPGEGRVLVVTAAGKKVMEFNNISSHDDNINGNVFNGAWVPPDYFDDFPNCLAREWKGDGN